MANGLQLLQARLGDRICANEPLSHYTTLGIGGPALLFGVVASEEELCEFVQEAVQVQVPYLVIGSGSNLLVSDGGFPGFVILNSSRGIERSDNTLVVRSGEHLQSLVDFAVSRGLAGLEALTGIPGTVGGAVHGNAGAYGQSISDHLVSVKAFNGTKTRVFAPHECAFAYRTSKFKTNGFVVLEAEFDLLTGEPEELSAKAREILEIRNKKYPPGIRCPGSFFKNILIDDLSAKALKRIPEDKIMFGKVPAGFLLEAVGARGAKLGGIEVADYHANLFVNTGEGTAKDFLALADAYAAKVKEKFLVTLSREVEYIS